MSAGVFGSAVLPSRLSVASSPEQGDPAGQSTREPPPGVYGHAFSSAHVESDASPDPEVRLKQTDGVQASLRCDAESRDLCVLQDRVRLSRLVSDKMHQWCLEQQDTPPARRRLNDDVKGERSTAVTAITPLSLSS